MDLKSLCIKLLPNIFMKILKITSKLVKIELVHVIKLLFRRT